MGKIKIRSGTAEIDIELSGEDFGAALGAALDAMERLRRFATPDPVPDARPHKGAMAPIQHADEHGISAGINTVVARLGGGSSRAILHAAAVHLSLVDNLEVFSRDAWLKRAHEARDWQSSYANNQSRDIARMISGDDILEKSANTYSMPSSRLSEAKGKLSDV